MSCEDWKEVKLGDVCEKIQYGYTQSAVKEKIGPKFLRITDIREQYFNWRSVPYCDISKSDFLKYRLYPGDIVIARTGATTGISKYIDQTVPNAVFASYLIRIRVKDEINSRFVGYVVSSEKYKRYIKSILSGSAQPNANAKQLTSFVFQLPSREEQNKISEILSSLDNKIELNHKINQDLEEMAQAIFKSWFVDFEPFRDGEFVDSELGPIPKGWEISNVLNIIDEVKEKNKDRNSYPVLTVTKSSKFVLSDDYFSKKVYSKDTRNYKIIRKYDVGFNPSRANIGSIAMLLDYEKGLLSPIYKVFRLKENVTPVYFNYYMKQKSFLMRIQHHSIGTTRQNFDLKSFEAFPICIPPRTVQEEFIQLISPIQKKINLCLEQNQILSNLRDTLLPKLMFGEIRV